MTGLIILALIVVAVACIAVATDLWDKNRALNAELEKARAVESAVSADLAETLDDLALAPAPVSLVPFDSLSRAERAHIAADRPDLRVVPPLDDATTWPRLAEAIELETTTPVHDELAVEVFMEQVERWGDEA